MNNIKVFRIAGIVMLVGGLLMAIVDVSSFWLPPSLEFYLVEMIAVGLGIFGAFALYSYQMEKIGWPGLIGFIILTVGLLLQFSFDWGGVVIIPEIRDVAPEFMDGPDLPLSRFLISVRTQLMGLGALLFGISTWKAHRFPRGAAALLILGSFTGALSAFDIVNLFPFGEIALASVGLAWMGLWLIRHPRTA